MKASKVSQMISKLWEFVQSGHAVSRVRLVFVYLHHSEQNFSICLRHFVGESRQREPVGMDRGDHNRCDHVLQAKTLPKFDKSSPKGSQYVPLANYGGSGQLHPFPIEWNGLFEIGALILLQKRRAWVYTSQNVVAKYLE